ncbi:MAG: PDZ domain-containing protein [Bryobacteraceae bacterium]
MPLLNAKGMIAGALAVVAWGSLGLYQGLNTGFSGGLYDTGYRVPGVRPGGLADRSGFKPGDRVVSVEGIPVEELGMESRWPRALVPRIGETRRFVVERNGARAGVDVVFPAPFAAAVQNRIRAALTGLAFLAFGLWAFLTVPTSHARALARLGLVAGAGASLGLSPHLASWKGVQGHLSTAAGVLMAVLLLRFFVTFPRPEAVSRSRIAAWLVYGAWGGLLVFLAVETMVHPALYYTTGSVAGLLTLAYGVLILAAIAHTLVKGPPAEARESGMWWIAGGLAVAFLGTFAWPASLPGWTSVTCIAAVPFSMALAVRKQAAR